MSEYVGVHEGPVFPVLDSGSFQLIESWGSDRAVVEAARLSTQKGFLGWGPIHDPVECAWKPDYGDCDCPGGPKAGDEKLLRTLYTLNHSSPFEFGGMTVEVVAPIVVFREWHRHRTQGYAEHSARYGPLPDLNYVPTVERCFKVNEANKQAGTMRGSNPLTVEACQEWLERLESYYAAGDQLYHDGLDIGLPKEIARLANTVGRYSKMRATANLRNWIGFIILRDDLSAMWEIRQYAKLVVASLNQQFPRTMDIVAEIRGRR